MTKAEFAAVLGWKEKAIAGRLGALGLLAACSRCAGSGHFSYCQSHGTTCFGCGGSGRGLPKLTAALAETVRTRVEAGELKPYFAACLAKAEARRRVGPLVAAAREAYGEVGAAYDAEYRRVYGAEGDGSEMDPGTVSAQSMNNSLFYGDTMRGVRGPSAGPATMSVCDVERAVNSGEIGAVEAAETLSERVLQLEILRDAFFGSRGIPSRPSESAA